MESRELGDGYRAPRRRTASLEEDSDFESESDVSGESTLDPAPTRRIPPPPPPPRGTTGQRVAPPPPLLPPSVPFFGPFPNRPPAPTPQRPPVPLLNSPPLYQVPSSLSGAQRTIVGRDQPNQNLCSFARSPPQASFGPSPNRWVSFSSPPALLDTPPRQEPFFQPPLRAGQQQPIGVARRYPPPQAPQPHSFSPSQTSFATPSRQEPFSQLPARAAQQPIGVARPYSPPRAPQPQASFAVFHPATVVAGSNRLIRSNQPREMQPPRMDRISGRQAGGLELHPGKLEPFGPIFIDDS
jgi:hypothetical protein